MKRRDAILIGLFQKMHEHTLSACKGNGDAGCRVPLSCCDPFYCKLAKEWAREEWGIDLKGNEDNELQFMGPDGCIVDPHLRPLCTMHNCKINGMGCTSDQNWDRKYFSIRKKIDHLESLRFAEKQDQT